MNNLGYHTAAFGTMLVKRHGIRVSRNRKGVGIARAATARVDGSKNERARHWLIKRVGLKKTMRGGKNGYHDSKLPVRG
jgi:hypothetical protein